MNIEMILDYRGDCLLWNTNLGVRDADTIGNQLKNEGVILNYNLTNMSTENMYKGHRQEQLEEELKMIRLNIESRRNV